MSQVPLAPPPPTGGPLDGWLYLLWRRLTQAGQVLWGSLDFSGSNLTDLETRNHADLQNIDTATYTHLTATQATDLTDSGSTTLHKHDHNGQDGLQGGTTNEYYHLTSARHTDLTDGGDSTLHYHASDRALANTTGLGTGVGTALAINIGTAGAPVVNGGALGIPSSGTVTNLTGTASININGTVGATTPAAGTFTTLTTTGNATLGDAEATDTHAIKGATTLLANSASAALTVTQAGSGNAFVVEDSASPDSSPFVINGIGKLTIGETIAPPSGYWYSGPQVGILGTSSGMQTACQTIFLYDGTAYGPVLSLGKSRSTTIGTAGTIVENADRLGVIEFVGDDGTDMRTPAAVIDCLVDGTPGTNDMPGRLVFSTTANGASTPTEALRIDSTQSIYNNAAGSGTNAYGFNVSSAKIGATNNYGFFGDIASGTGRWNFYAAGSANNAFAGNSSFGQVVAPIAAVDTTSFATNLVTNTGSTYTVLTTDHTIIQTTAASVYTLPAAASFTGRILHLVTQFAGTVTSASSNVVPIAGGAAGTAILAATAGKFATLQSNGTNWIIIASN